MKTKCIKAQSLVEWQEAAPLCDTERTEKGHPKCNIMRQEGRWWGERREDSCANNASFWDTRHDKINTVFSRFTYVNLSCSRFFLSQITRTPRFSLRKLFITSRRRDYSALACSLYLSTHQSHFYYRYGDSCLLCCSRHKQTEIVRWSNLCSWCRTSWHATGIFSPLSLVWNLHLTYLECKTTEHNK